MKLIEELGVSPAPWEQGERVPFCQENVVRCKFRREDGSEHERIVATCNATFSEEQARIDAKLISAAPDLYEALRLCMAELCNVCRSNTALPCVTMCETICIAREALEKAGGAE